MEFKKKNFDQWPHILKLLDDDSHVVRRAVAAELDAFDVSLEGAWDQLDLPPTEEERKQIQDLIFFHRSEMLKIEWKTCFKKEPDENLLEKAVDLLSHYLSGRTNSTLASLLDDLAAECRDSNAHRSAEDLAIFLFQTKGFRGVQEDYYRPENSNLIHVIHMRKGIPLSLVCLYMLVGKRLNLSIEGCNFPGHFLARIFVKDQMMFVDCFNGGKLLKKEAFHQMKNRRGLDIVLNEPASAEQMIHRILNNLIRAFRETHQLEQAEFIADLLSMLPSEPEISGL